MFDTTLRYLNLIILPHPSFDVPPSEPDPEFQVHGRKGDHDTSYISQNQISQFGPIEFSTPRRLVLKANSIHERRRNTICCYSCHLGDSFPASEDIPTNISFNSFLSSDTSRHPFYENISVPSTSAGVKIATPHASPSPSSSRIEQPRVTSFVGVSDTSDDRVSAKKLRNKRRNTSKWKQKRNSAPPAVSLNKERFSVQDSGVIDITSTDELQSIQPPDTTQWHSTLLRKDQCQNPHATSVSSYALKHFEIGLSPIIEDTHTFANALRGPKIGEKKPATSDILDSSESSYGELIQNKTINYLSTSEYETFEWENQEQKKPPLSFAHFDTQNYADLRGDRYWSDEFWETFEDSSHIPELTLTAPTPEMAMSAKFRSEGPSELSCDGSLDYRLPDTKAYRPGRLGYTALASISKALGTGTDMLLGVGDGVFDDMLDAGLNSSGVPQLPASAHSRENLGVDWLGSSADQPLGESQTETGFLKQLLRRKNTRRSKMSERTDRAWKRLSRILRSSGRSRSAHDQEKPSAPAPAGPLDKSHAANELPNTRWKRFSRILGNTIVSSRRRSAGDQVSFTEFIDPLEAAHTGFSDFGSTRRHGLDIPSDSMNDIERWYGSSSARPAYNNEKHTAIHLDKPSDTRKNTVKSGNWYGNSWGTDVTKSPDHKPRRHSFGFGLGKRISKPRWRTSAEGHGGSWSTENERIQNRIERYSAVY